MGQGLEGRGVWQLLQDAVLLEVLLRPPRHLTHNARDHQHIRGPRVCKVGEVLYTCAQSLEL